VALACHRSRGRAGAHGLGVVPVRLNGIAGGTDRTVERIMAENQQIALEQIDDYRWRIPRSGKMRVDGLVYADEILMRDIRGDQSLVQVKNVAELPGILDCSLAMPDIHWGYGFPIGGVAAMDAEQGVISPGGVGYDIN
jgi:hypothetical protein